MDSTWQWIGQVALVMTICGGISELNGTVKRLRASIDQLQRSIDELKGLCAAAKGLEAATQTDIEEETSPLEEDDASSAEEPTVNESALKKKGTRCPMCNEKLQCSVWYRGRYCSRQCFEDNH